MPSDSKLTTANATALAKKCGLDPKLAEIILAEIVDGSLSKVSFDDVAGQEKAKQALR